MKKLLIILSAVLFVSGCAEPSTAQKLQGKWSSLDDSKATMEFADNKKIDFYDNEIMGEGKFEIKKIGEQGKHIWVTIDGEVFQYPIIELTDKSLTLMHFPRGNMLKYRKEQS